MSIQRILVFGFLLFSLSCSTTGLYEKVAFLPKQQWSRADTPTFTFGITDTVSSYRIYFLIRHADAYAYNNLWIKLQSRTPGDSAAQTARFEIPLATDKGWLGSAMDDIVDHRVLLYPDPVRFSSPGTYTVTIQHDMRVEPLKHVLNAGLRLEKIN